MGWMNAGLRGMARLVDNPAHFLIWEAVPPGQTLLWTQPLNPDSPLGNFFFPGPFQTAPHFPWGIPVEPD